jgi:hypothetical protein
MVLLVKYKRPFETRLKFIHYAAPCAGNLTDDTPPEDALEFHTYV